MHTKELILQALQELRDNYNPAIRNPMYRGSLEKHIFFTVKEIAEKVDKSISTVRKWCKVLAEEKKLIMQWKKCYFANDPETMEFRRSDSKIVKLKPFKWKEVKNVSI